MALKPSGVFPLEGYKWNKIFHLKFFKLADIAAFKNDTPFYIA